MEMLMERKRRSEKMTREEHRAFIKYVKSFPTQYDAALALGVSRITIGALVLKGSGKTDTIRLIREKLNNSVQ